MTLRVLAVDDEAPALDELAYLLRADVRVEEVLTASDAAAALRVLEHHDVQAVFLDIRMPGLDGLELARVLGRFADPPAVVFVTAHDEAAVDAFALHATDYLLKPLRPERLTEAVRRVLEARQRSDVVEDTIAVELGGITRFVPVAAIEHVEAHGDYARLHTADGNHLVRVSLATLEERWSSFGFVRTHRSHLVALSHILELRVDATGGHVVTSGGARLPVSRRHSRDLKDRLVRRG